MSAAISSKFAINPFLHSTRKRFPLMDEILADTGPRATVATAGDTSFTAILAELAAATTAWNSGATVIANAEAALGGLTLAFDDWMEGLRRQPDADTASLLEQWDSAIRAQVSYRGPVYRGLLPDGRRTLTHGSPEEQIDALRDFGIRLTAQTSRPVLVALGTTVTAFSTTARSRRTAQTTAKAALETARAAQEHHRLRAAEALYGLLGQGIATWRADPSRVDTLWDVNFLRRGRQHLPAAPAATTWDPATRTLSTPAMPAAATRLQAWRQGPGSMPELLLTGPSREISITLPANITFSPGGLYQLWLVALNSTGHSTPGPVQSWMAE
ncbi:MAG: hypothetical protein V4689_08475 [Verrucomicrobiota bacterium]